MLDNLIELYATDKEKFDELINQESSENLKILLKEILKQYFNDLNSSTLRETVTDIVAGYKPIHQKLGYDGIKVTEEGNKKYCEVKPKNFIVGHTNSKLNAGGNFTDFSWKKLKRYSQDNPAMLVSGFVNGELVYILEFDFNNEGFKNRLKEQLEKQFPNGEDRIGSWLRSAQFSFKHFKDYGYKKIYVRKDIVKYFEYLTIDLFNELKK